MRRRVAAAGGPSAPLGLLGRQRDRDAGLGDIEKETGVVVPEYLQTKLPRALRELLLAGLAHLQFQAVQPRGFLGLGAGAGYIHPRRAEGPGLANVKEVRGGVVPEDLHAEPAGL